MSDVGVNVSTGDPDVDALLQGGVVPGAGAGDAPSPLGGFVAPPAPVQVAVPGGAPLDGGGRFEPYFAGDEVGILRSLPLEDRVRVQDELVSLGLTSSVIPGELDDGTVGGFRDLLVMSNRHGTSWRSTIGRLRSLDAQGLLGSSQDREFEPPPSLTPDYATIAQEVKAVVLRRLGREPDAYEMQELTAELTGFHALENEAAQELARIQFEQETTPGVQDGGTVQRVDPGARFRELFESKFRNELDFVQDKEDAQVSRQIVQSGVDTLSQMSRGSQ